MLEAISTVTTIGKATLTLLVITKNPLPTMTVILSQGGIAGSDDGLRALATPSGYWLKDPPNRSTRQRSLQAFSLVFPARIIR